MTGQADSFGFDDKPFVDLAAGTDLGGVTVIRLLAEGGMGRVYEGRQHSPGRPVAVKILRSGLANPEMMRRFEHEAHLLARLRHPHIAQVYTLGTWLRDDLHMPFFIMELVDGALPIDRFAVERQLTVRQRMTLAQRVAAAVAHGHRHGIVHRDLKPGNILVGFDGEPKVIDFGVAMSTDADRALTTMQSDVGRLVGTLRYMSPEQFDADASRIGTATDVYALGLVLHELLIGELPYDVRGKPIAVAARIIREQEPRIVSAFSRGIRHEERIDASQIRQLAAVVDKCLQKLPTDRYATADALAAELARWLAGEPVLARPTAVVERSIRWVRRRPLVATAAALVCLASMAAVLFSSHARQQARLAEWHRMAEKQEAYSSAVQRAGAAADRRTIAIAAKHLERARSLSAISGQPIELDCLEAVLDDSVSTLRGHEAILRAVAAAPGGDRLVTGDDRGVVRLWSSVGRPVHGESGPGEWGLVSGRPPEGHRAAIWSAAVSPDARRAVTASADGVAKLWDLIDGSQAGSLVGHAGAIYGCAIAPDGRSVATASADGTVAIWEAPKGRRIAVITPPWRPGARDRNVYGVTFIGDGRRIALACGDGAIRLVNVSLDEPHVDLLGHARRVFAVSWDPASRRLASASEDGTARVWDLDTSRCVAVMRHPLRVNGVAWTTNGSALVTVSADAVVRVWNASDGRLLREMVGHRDAVWSVASIGDDQIVTGSADVTARVWDLRERSAPILRCGGEQGEGVRAVAFSHDGRLIATATTHGRVRLWDRQTCTVHRDLVAIDGRVNSVEFSPAGDILAAACGDGFIRLYGLNGLSSVEGEDRAGTERRMVSHSGPVFAAAFAPDGLRIAAAGSDPQPAGPEKGSVRIHDVISGTATSVTLSHPARVHGVAWSPDGRRLVTACADGLVREWDSATAMQLGVHRGHRDDVNWVAWSASGSGSGSEGSDRIASASSDGTVRLWNPSRNWSSVELEGPVGQVWETAFSPDGSRVAGVGADGSLHLWHVESGRHLLALDGHDGPLWGVTFAPDGRSILTGSDDGSARVWGLSPAGLLGSRRVRSRLE